MKKLIKNLSERILYSLVGAFLGLSIGGFLTYLIIFIFIPKEQGAALIFIIVFALITSQLGIILGQYFALKKLEKQKKSTTNAVT